MQTVRLNPRSGGGDDSAIWCSVRMGLPLPGPPLGGSPFPQEAYLEITTLYLQPHHHQQWSSGASKRAKEGDRVKLMKENSYEDQSDALIHEMKKAAAAHGKTWIQEPGEGGRGREDGGPLVSLGLTQGGGGPLPTRSSSPGAYPGSIGFHSNGSVYLDGKIVQAGERPAGKGDGVPGGGEPGPPRYHGPSHRQGQGGGPQAPQLQAPLLPRDVRLPQLHQRRLRAPSADAAAASTACGSAAPLLPPPADRSVRRGREGRSDGGRGVWHGNP